MNTRERILQILRSEAASRIRFTFPSALTGHTVTIGPGTFTFVARAIESGRIHVQVTNHLPAGTGAQYFPTADPTNNPPVPSANTILTPQVLGRELEGRAIHECVHAAYDLLRTDITALDDEASAYLVQTLYYRMTGIAQPRWDTRIRSMAVNVANLLLQEYARGTHGIPSVPLITWEMLRLWVYTSTSPNYAAGPAGTGGSYTHDG